MTVFVITLRRSNSLQLSKNRSKIFESQEKFKKKNKNLIRPVIIHRLDVLHYFCRPSLQRSILSEKKSKMNLLLSAHSFIINQFSTDLMVMVCRDEHRLFRHSFFFCRCSLCFVHFISNEHLNTNVYAIEH